MRDSGVSIVGMFTGFGAMATSFVENANHWIAFAGGLLFLFSTVLAIIHSFRALFKGKSNARDEGDRSGQ
jgi:putative Mn2+ efflux pump MntP